MLLLGNATGLLRPLGFLQGWSDPFPERRHVCTPLYCPLGRKLSPRRQYLDSGLLEVDSEFLGSNLALIMGFIANLIASPATCVQYLVT